MKQSWQLRLEKTIYGLIYPAYFGNMMYDLINLILKNEIGFKYELEPTLILFILIIMFVVVDYIHLNADLNSIYDEPEFKNIQYFICDIFTPTILFLSFVLIKEPKTFIWGVIAFSCVPMVIFIYKYSNPSSKIFFIFYFIISLLIGGIFYTLKSSITPYWVSSFFSISLICYSYYTFIYYPKFSREYDLKYVENLKSKKNK